MNPVADRPSLTFIAGCRLRPCWRQARPYTAQLPKVAAIYRHALRAAVGQPHPQGAQGRRGAARSVQGQRERGQCRLHESVMREYANSGKPR